LQDVGAFHELDRRAEGVTDGAAEETAEEAVAGVNRH
jgi:hypothetical protein